MVSNIGYISVYLPLLVAYLQLIAATPTWYSANDGNSYFIEGDKKYNWLQANDLCARQGLQLVVIDDAAKNAAFDELLRRIFPRSPDLWLGYHDEFNREKSTARPFYSLASGKKLTFSNWNKGEPNNDKNEEHCANIYSATDYKWNDGNCETWTAGYICEKHYLSKQSNQDMEQKRKAVNQKNTQLSSEFGNTQNEITRTIKDLEKQTNTILLELRKSTEDIVAKAKSSFSEIIKKKPYLRPVIADVGDDINMILLDSHKEISILAAKAGQTIEECHVDAVDAANDVCGKFANKLTDNTNAVDKLLVL